VYNSSTPAAARVNSYKNESCGGICNGGANEPTYSASPNQVCGGFKLQELGGDRNQATPSNAACQQKNGARVSQEAHVSTTHSHRGDIKD
jgi:hypothetical protein